MLTRDIMSSPAVCATESTSLDEVAAIMVGNGFTAVPVIDEDGRLIGVISEVDVIRERFGLHSRPQLVGSDGDQRSTVAQAMTSPVEFVAPTTLLSALANRMVTGRRRSMPVVEDDRVVGVVTRRDVVEMLARTDATILEEVSERLGGLTSGEWLVRVKAGVVHLWGDTDPLRQREAISLAESVSGVIRVTVSGPARRRA